MPLPDIQSPVQFLETLNDVEVSILREDRLHPLISGNKFRKLKYNLLEFNRGSYSALLTFGGAYSNHIHATAAAGREFGIPTIGIIRGEEVAEKIADNPTLSFAQKCGMKFKFVSRTEYRQKEDPGFWNALKEEFNHPLIIPEGGSNENGIKGAEEILYEKTKEFDYICCAAGTGGTVTGIIKSSEKDQHVLVFPALKDSDFLNDFIKKHSSRRNYSIINPYHFGGFAKINKELVKFINDFKTKFNVPLDPIYTGKMMFGLWDCIQKGEFKKGSRILAVHTGGLQGICAMNKHLKKKNEVLIK